MIIRRVKELQARAIASLGTLLVAAAVSVGNYFGNATYDGVKLGFDQQSWMTLSGNEKGVNILEDLLWTVCSGGYV